MNITEQEKIIIDSLLNAIENTTDLDRLDAVKKYVKFLQAIQLRLSIEKES
jgi:hypothetical protein